MNKTTRCNEFSFIILLIIVIVLSLLLLSGCKQLQSFYPTPENYTSETKTTINNTNNENINETTNETLGVGYLPYDNFTVYFQKLEGKSAIVKLGNNSLLIDGGAESDSGSILKNLRNVGVHELDYIIISNSNIGNIGGLPYIILRANPKKIYDNGIPILNAEFYRDLYSNTTTVEKDTAFVFDDVFVKLIVPYDDGLGISDIQEGNSIIVKLIYKDIRILFMSDCDFVCEERIYDADLSADFLVVSDNCDSTSLVFLGKVNPDNILIRKDCPEIKKRLDYFGLEIYENFGYVLVSDGKDYTVNRIS